MIENLIEVIIIIIFIVTIIITIIIVLFSSLGILCLLFKKFVRNIKTSKFSHYIIALHAMYKK